MRSSFCLFVVAAASRVRIPVLFDKLIKGSRDNVEGWSREEIPGSPALNHQIPGALRHSVEMSHRPASILIRKRWRDPNSVLRPLLSWMTILGACAKFSSAEVFFYGLQGGPIRRALACISLVMIFESCFWMLKMECSILSASWPKLWAGPSLSWVSEQIFLTVSGVKNSELIFLCLCHAHTHTNCV